MQVRIAFIVAIVGLALGWITLKSQNASLEEKVAASSGAKGQEP